LVKEGLMNYKDQLTIQGDGEKAIKGDAEKALQEWVAGTQDEQRLPGLPVIRVFGVGGGGCNAISRMPKEKLPSVEYYAVNTDVQHLSRCDVGHRIAIGQELTRGLGVGANPEMGRRAADESTEVLQQAVAGADMVFMGVGMGGGTGSGAAPIIAQLAKEAGALTVAVVIRPFGFEASIRRKNADEGIARLQEQVDTLIVIPNERLLLLEEHKEQAYTWEDALRMADSVLQQGIQAIAEVVTVPGEINVDFADVKTTLTDAGQAWLAIGSGKGESRARDAARQAAKSPLLDISIEGAKRLLFVVTGGSNLSLREVQEASDVIHEMADTEANVIFGTVKDQKMDDEIRVTMVAAAFPVPQDLLADREEDLRLLLREPMPSESDDLDIPSFLRKKSGKKRGFFR
jgi:cell division protein FtsZ